MQDRFDASENSQDALKINFGTPKETPKSSFLVSKVVPKLLQDCSNASESSPSLVSPGARLRILIQLQIFKFCQAWQGISRRKSFRTGKRTQWLRWGFLQKPKFDSLWTVTSMLERLSCMVDTRRFENHMKTFSTWMIDQRLVSVPPCILIQSRQWKWYPMKGNRVIKFAN